MKHLRTLFDLSPDDLRSILMTAIQIKSRLDRGDRPDILKNHVAALLFEKQSLRTRVSFETGMRQMGGGSLFLGQDVGWGKRETPADFTRVLGQFVDVVVCRAKSHDRVEELASFDAVPVINGLTDLCHPCQAIADVLTMLQTGHDDTDTPAIDCIDDIAATLRDKHLVFVGDGNNVANSLALIAAMLNFRFTLARPDGYAMDTAWLDRVGERYNIDAIRQTDSPGDAVADADVIYTDVWTSMGQEEESARRRKDFADFQVNESLMAAAPPTARVLHCLPAVRDEEITDAVLESPQSDVIRQAGNRMHAQKALLVHLLNPEWIRQNVR